MSTKSKINLWLYFGLLGTLFLVPGLIALYLAAQGVAREYQTHNWLHTDGVVDVSEVVTQEAPGPADQPSAKVQKAHIVYSYKIGNSIYASDRVSFLQDMNRSPSLHAEYPKGKKVTVYYSPDNPSSAVLEQRTSRDIWLAPPLWAHLAFAIIFIGVALLFFSLLRFSLKNLAARN